jgi:hypothetical protein
MAPHDVHGGIAVAGSRLQTVFVVGESGKRKTCRLQPRQRSNALDRVMHLPCTALVRMANIESKRWI